MTDIAPPGQTSWSGQNWYRTSGLNQPSIMVIDSPRESYDEYADRKQRERKARKVPFGFALASDDEHDVVDTESSDV